MDPVAAHLEDAHNAILSCDYDAAVSACVAALEQFPKHIEANLLLAEAYREQGRFDAAEDLLRRVLSADPENVLACWALGLLLRDKERDPEALAMLITGRELAPANAELLGDLLSMAKDPRSAVRPTRSLLGRFYANAGLYDRAAEEFRGVVLSDPRRLDAWVALAEALWRGGEHDEATAVCEAILSEAPHCLKAIIVLARLRARDERTSASQALLALAHELDPADTMVGKLV